MTLRFVVGPQRIERSRTDTADDPPYHSIHDGQYLRCER